MLNPCLQVTESDALVEFTLAVYTAVKGKLIRDPGEFQNEPDPPRAPWLPKDPDLANDTTIPLNEDRAMMWFVTDWASTEASEMSLLRDMLFLYKMMLSSGPEFRSAFRESDKEERSERSEMYETRSIIPGWYHEYRKKGKGGPQSTYAWMGQERFKLRPIDMVHEKGSEMLRRGVDQLKRSAKARIFDLVSKQTEEQKKDMDKDIKKIKKRYDKDQLRILDEDQVIGYQDMPFPFQLSAEDSERLMIFCSTPAVCAPLVIGFFADRARILMSQRFQGLLWRALWDPVGLGITVSRSSDLDSLLENSSLVQLVPAPPSTSESRATGFDGFDLGSVHNDLATQPQSILRPLLDLCMNGTQLSTCQFDETRTQFVLFLVRLVVGIEAMAHHVDGLQYNAIKKGEGTEDSLRDHLRALKSIYEQRRSLMANLRDAVGSMVKVL